VGIDRIIAEAEVAKATLYIHFPTKDDLILAVLQHREQSTSEFFRTAMKRHAKAKGPLGPFFAALREWFETPGFRGCAFQNAAVELADPKHPGTEFAKAYKQRFNEFLRRLIEESVGAKAAKLAPGPTLSALRTVPAPVCIPQPSGPSNSRGTSLCTFTTLRSFAMA